MTKVERNAVREAKAWVRAKVYPTQWHISAEIVLELLTLVSRQHTLLRRYRRHVRSTAPAKLWRQLERP